MYSVKHENLQNDGRSCKDRKGYFAFIKHPLQDESETVCKILAEEQFFKQEKGEERNGGNEGVDKVDTIFGCECG